MSKRLLGLSFAALLFGLFSMCLTFFLKLNFGTVSWSELVSYLSLGGNGIAGADLLVKIEFVLMVLLLPGFIGFALSVAPLNYRQRLVTAVALGSVTLFVLLTLSPQTYISEATVKDEGSVEVRDTYTLDPDASLANVIHIFVESLPPELSISGEPNREAQDKILRSLGNDSITGSVVAGRVGGTVSAVMSAMCGTSDLPEGYLDSQSNEFMLQNIDCLPEKSHRLGFENIFLQGASGEFQAKEDLLAANGFSVLEKETWLSIGATEISSWGQTIHDDRLMSHSQALANRLLSDRVSFYLSVLTLDSHSPHYIPESCQTQMGDTSRDLASYLCSANSVASFIDWYRLTSETATLLVVQGDTPPDSSLTKNSDIFFAYACHLGDIENVRKPDRYSEIAAFTANAMRECGA